MVLMILLLVLLIPALAIVLDSPVGRALAARMEPRGLRSGSDDGTSDRLSYLEGEVERLTTQVSRLEEESQFLNQLLDDRPSSSLLPPGEQNR
jgi:hypothetical protein